MLRLREFRRFVAVVCVISAATLLGACTVTYPVVAQFDDYNEVMVGTVVHNLSNGTALIEAKGEKSGLRCTGTSRVVHVPASNFIAGAFLIPYCTGQRGIATLRCADGRTATADWEASSCTAGAGQGNDQKGTRFSFAFGMSEDEARKHVAEALKTAESKPEFPTYVPQQTRKEVGYSTGTAFLVSEDGYLVTNSHVIEKATRVSVIVDGREIPAIVQRVDSKSDLALLKIDYRGKPLPIALAGIRRGDEVFTLGFPLISIQGQEQKATFGRVNALSGIRDDQTYLQVDVPIQPGNSGGPLISSEGYVVGVVTATLDQVNVLRRAGTIAQNVNYAIKGNYVSDLSGIAAKPAVAASPRMGMADLVEAYTNSVFLVIAR